MKTNAERFREARIKRYWLMPFDELDKLNGKTVGKGDHWVTQERDDICSVLGARMAAYFRKERARP